MREFDLCYTNRVALWVNNDACDEIAVRSIVSKRWPIGGLLASHPKKPSRGKKRKYKCDFYGGKYMKTYRYPDI